MKKSDVFTRFAAVLLLLAAGTGVFAAENRSVQVYTLDNGIPVYYMQNNSSKIDNVKICVTGGFDLLTPETGGLEDALFQTMSYGSEKYSYDYLQAVAYSTGAGLSYGPGRLVSTLGLTSICDYLPYTLDILTDCFMNPVYDETNYSNMMTLYSTQIQQTYGNPASYAFKTASDIMFEGHPYATSIQPDEKSIYNITIENMKNLHSVLMDSRRIFVVAVTSYDPDELVSSLNLTLGTIAAQDSEIMERKTVPPLNIAHDPIVVTHPYAEGTSDVFRFVPAPSIMSDEFYAFGVACKIYNTILFNLVRAKYGICYTPYTMASSTDANYAAEVLASCSSPDELKPILAEARRILAAGLYIIRFDEDGSCIFGDIAECLEGARNSKLNEVYANYLTSGNLTDLMSIGIVRYGEPFRYMEEAEKYGTVTREQVIEVFRKYFLSQEEFWVASTGPSWEGILNAALNY